MFEKHADSDEIGAAIFEPLARADMAGQLMVKAREADEVKLVQDPTAFLGKPFLDAIQEFQARGLISDDELSTLLGDYALRADDARRRMLQTIQTRVRELLVKNLEEGGSFRDFAKDFDDVADSIGITNRNPSYLQTVYRTNLQSAYGAGRHRAMIDPVVQNARPFVQYRTAGDTRVRESHAVNNGDIYRSDDPAWLEIVPPNGFNCRCSFVTLSSDEMEEELASGRKGELRTSVPKAGKPDEGFEGPPIAQDIES